MYGLRGIHCGKILLLILLLLSLTACGQKGDLYLPGKQTGKTLSPVFT